MSTIAQGFVSRINRRILREMLKLRRSPRVKVVVLPAVSFQPVPTEAPGRCRYLVVIRVLAFVSSGVMIRIKSIDVHVGHESSVGVCFAKRSRKYRIESATRHG